MTVGRVYAIVNTNKSIRYVGSTTQTLNKRFSDHKSAYKSWIEGKSKKCCMIYHAFKEHGVESFHIELLEYVEFTDKCELLQAENKYITELECVNKQSAHRTSEEKREYGKQWYVANQDKIKEKHKHYREANRDKIKEKQNQQHDCECGGRFTAAHKAAHFKSKKHTDYLDSL